MLCSLPRLNALGRPARFQTFQEIQKPDRLPRAIPLGLGERLENTTVRELPYSLMDRGLGSPCHGSGNAGGDDGMRGQDFDERPRGRVGPRSGPFA